MFKRSFSRRLSWRIIGIVTIILVVMLVSVGIVSTQIIAEEAMRAAQHIKHGTINEIERPLGEVEIVTRTVAAHTLQATDGMFGDAHFVDRHDEAMEQMTHQTVALDSLISGCYIIFPSCTGNVVHYSCTDSSGVIHTSTMVDESLDSPTNSVVVWSKSNPSGFWTPPHPSAADSSANVTTFCCPVFLPGSQQLAAIVAADLPTAWMEHKVETLRPYKNSLTTIACGENSVIGIKDTAYLAALRKAFAEDKELAALNEDMRQGKDSLRRRIGKGREVSFIVYGPLHNGWILSIVCQYRDVLARTAQMQANLIIIGILGLIVLFAVCRIVIKRLSKPITQLSESALNMAKGDFTAELPEIKSQDEMKNLRDSFVFMQNSIADYIEELKTTTAANERMESELGVARNIQMGMLRTDFPPQLHALLNPAKEVGGDLYDYILKDKTLYFAVGDVSGKGVPASLMMAITRAALRFVSSLDLPMNETMSRINSSVCDINSNNMFVTLFVGRIDLTTGRMEYCNAGHNPIMILPEGGKPYFLKAKPNLAVGLFEDFPYQSESIDIVAGTRIVAYTDGVNEAENADKALFGNDRLLQWAEEVDANDSEQAVVESLYDAVKAFADGNPQNDDITIMSIKL